ncbi:MAG TPA: RNA polymerase sigma-70 factor [Gemmatimonadaceae bacterium]|nr:RNA polymerase sigma-70 factor [Gemmatimonadaceae bacterium]
MDDRQLMDRLKVGDQAAFDSIFRSYYPQLAGFLEAMLRDRAIGEELAQDVMLELWRRREQLELKESLRSYLFQAARNRALNHIRHERVARRNEPLVAGETSATVDHPEDSNLVDAEIETALRTAVAGLPDRCREVFELSRVNGLSYAEIAAALDISVKTVETQMGKALRVLREHMAPWLAAAGRK